MQGDGRKRRRRPTPTPRVFAPSYDQADTYPLGRPRSREGTTFTLPPSPTSSPPTSTYASPPAPAGPPVPGPQHELYKDAICELRKTDEGAVSSFRSEVGVRQRFENARQAILRVNSPKLPRYSGSLGEDYLFIQLSSMAHKLTPPLSREDIDTLATHFETGHPSRGALFRVYCDPKGQRPLQTGDQRIIQSILLELGNVHTNRQIATALYALEGMDPFRGYHYKEDQNLYMLAPHLRVIEWMTLFAAEPPKEPRTDSKHYLTLLMADGLFSDDFLTCWANDHSASPWSRRFNNWKNHYLGNQNSFPKLFDPRDPLCRVYPLYAPL